MAESFLSDFSFIKETLDKEVPPDFFGKDFSFFFDDLTLFYHAGKDAIVYVNRRFTDEFNYTADDLAEWKYSIYPLLHKDDHEAFRTTMKSLLENDGEYTPDTCYRLIAKNKNLRNFCFKTRKLYKAYYFINLTKDVTVQEQIMKDLLDYKKMMQENETFLNYGTWESNADGSQVNWSHGMYEIFGLADADKNTLASNHELYLRHIIGSDPEERNVADFLTDKDSYRLEYEIKDEKGISKILTTNARIIRDNEKNIQKIIGITSDITGVKEYEKILEKKIEELNKSNRQLEEFAYVASHDMQEPLRKISTFGMRLKNLFEGQLNQDGNLYLNRMLAASESMHNLINNLLAFSKISRDKESYEVLDLSAVTREVIEDLDIRTDEATANISVEDLPAIEAIPSQIRQLFFNLLHNAIKFRKKDSKLVIKIKQRKLNTVEKKNFYLSNQHEYYLITVADNGIGFEQQYAERIFQLFQRLEGKSEYPGTGIGLSICRKIVANHKGQIFAESKPDKGTVFSIILPQDQ